MPELLWEVGCEELPAWACEQLAAQVPQLVSRELVEARLVPAGADIMPVITVGPRRFAVQVGVLAETEAEEGIVQGPPEAIAFKDGAPTKAAEGFARKVGVPVDELSVEGGFVTARFSRPSRPLADIWPGIAERVLSGISFAKPMKWGASPQRFVRPVRWLVTLLGSDVIEYGLWDVESTRSSRTHRFLGDSRVVSVPSASAYGDTLAAGHVIVDHDVRRASIEQGLAVAAAELGGDWFDPGNVLDEVVHLVEQPTVITGRFDERYLELPERVLVTAMQSHQRYLPVRTGGGLANAFLAVMNGDPAAIDSIRPGYERVLAGRLDDAVFSFGRDRDRGLDDMADSLGDVVFHARAGSLADRTARIRSVAAAVAGQLGVDARMVDDAARLAKADQVSYVVQEFAELEGFAGSLYARSAGYDEQVVSAVDQQFRPRSATAALPDAGVAAVVSLADRLDLLATMFAIGEQPTGSRDPHGLRRAAIGIMRVVLEHDLPLDVDAALDAAIAAVAGQGHGIADGMELRSFIDDRVEKSLVDGGIRVDAVRAARAARLPQLQNLDGLARAFANAIGSNDANFLAVLDAVRRCTRILEKSGGEAAVVVDVERCSAPSELALHGRLAEVSGQLRDAVLERRYADAVALAATIGPEVDAFFDRERGVMVMADDLAVRANRLALLTEVLAVVEPLGDLGLLQVAS